MQRRITSQSGIGMIEVLVTIVITVVGLLGLSAMQMQSIRSVSDTGNRTHAIWIANDLINRIRANEVAMDNYVTDEMRCLDANGGSAVPDVKMCSAFSVGNNQQPPANCTNAELATYDLWESLCGVDQILAVEAASSSASFIVDPALTVTDLNNGDLNITISWSSRTAGRKGNDNVYYLESGKLAETQREDYSVVFRP